MRLNELNFRQFYHQVIFFKNEEALNQIKDKFESDEGDNGILAYGYVDDKAGSTFEVLCAASVNDGHITYKKGNPDASFKFRRDSAVNEEIYLFHDETIFSEFEEKIAMINDGYKAKNPAVELMRTFSQLDNSRNPDYPDAVLVYLMKEGLLPERCWVKCIHLDNNSLYGILLNEPTQDFGIRKNEMMMFGIANSGDRDICVANFN